MEIEESRLKWGSKPTKGIQLLRKMQDGVKMFGYMKEEGVRAEALASGLCNHCVTYVDG
jgi:hypothetical protein